MVANDTGAGSDTRFDSGCTFAAVVNSAMSFSAFVSLMCDARNGDMAWGCPPLQDTETGQMVFEA
jgi:hypothetical protein